MSTARRTVHTKKPFVSAGLGHSAAVLEAGDLVTWGTSRQKQLGHDVIKEKDRRNGKTEEDLGLPQDSHSPKEVPEIKMKGEQIRTVAAGSSHTLAVTETGHVYSWGSGAFGKLGHNDLKDVRIPKPVEFKRKRIARIACGPDHSAAISEQGEVLTWGAGSYGNLGHGDNTDITAPKLVEALLGKKCISVACGSKHTLALTAAGGVFSWGYGGGGRLGCGDTRGLFRPKLVESLKDQPCLLIAAGESHSMAVTAERGQCFTWGVGDYGKLGHGDTTPQQLPRHLEYFRQHCLTWVSGGTFHSAGCSDQGMLFTWGGGTYGKLGQMDTINSLTPRPVKNVTDTHFVQVSCGTFHTLALTNSGDMYSFGFNGNGRLGLADPSGGTGMDNKPRKTPELIKSVASLGAKDTEDIGLPVDDSQAATTALVKALRPKKISHLCLGGFYSAALSDQGDVYTWGDGRQGATGLDLSRQEEKEVQKPTRVLGLGGARNSVKMLAAGVRHLIAVTDEGLCYSWGDGTLGRLGHGDQTMVSEPRVISTLKQVVVTSAAAGEEHSAATTSEGTLYTWGSGSFGKLGHGEPSDETTPRKVQLDAKNVIAVGCGYAHSVALCASYDVLVWGSGFKGKLGLSDDQNRLVPTPIASLKRKHIKSIACGSFHTLVLTEQGDVYSWGIGERGQLGHGDLENRKTPTIVLNGFGSSSEGVAIGCIAAGEAHSIASSLDCKKVWSWGAGHYGQLGLGNLDPKLSPMPIMELIDQQVTQVACGANHSGAVSGVDGGKVLTWGNGANSRLGNQLTDEQDVPHNVPTLSKDTLTNAKNTGVGGEEPSRLVTPDMVSRLHGTDIDAATAQRVLDDSSQLATRAKQADDVQSRQDSMTGGDGLKEEMANTEKDDASTVSTVMAVAMAGRAIKPSLDVLQQLVKSQRENVSDVIDNEHQQIDKITKRLDEEVRRNEELESGCLDFESKVKLVLSNHKTMHENFTKAYGYVRIQMMPGMSGSSFEKDLYEKMVSILYQEPQYLSVMLKKAESDEVMQKKADADETNKLVAVICDRIYSNHYKARDEYYILSLIMHATGEDMTNVTEPTGILASVNYATKLMAAYTRRGPNTEALKEALFKPLSLVLARKKLDLEIDPARVYKTAYDELKFKLDTTDTKLPEEVPALQAWGFKEVRDIIEPRVKTLLELVELFLTRIIAARNMLPYGVRALAKKVYEMAQDRFPKADWPAKMAGVANFIFTTYLCPAIIQPEAFDLCSASSRPTADMKKNLLRIATTLKAIGSLKLFDNAKEPWFDEIAAKVKVSEELMKQFYSNLCDVQELEDQRSAIVVDPAPLASPHPSCRCDL